jgi:hypothetical protein
VESQRPKTREKPKATKTMVKPTMTIEVAKEEAGVGEVVVGADAAEDEVVAV